MVALYTLKVLVDFAAAHALKGYPGPCSRLHGHNWKVEVEVSARALDEIGMALDFKTIRKAAKGVIGELDHHYLNDLSPFTQINPTAENIAAYLFRRLSDQLNRENIKVSAVILWETDRACVRYSESA